MPNPISGQYRRPGDIRQQNREKWKADAQLQRAMTQPRSAAAGGGIEGVTRAIGDTYGSYFTTAGKWGCLYAQGHTWTTSSLGGTAPAVSTQSVSLTSDGLDSLVVAKAGWYSFRLAVDFNINTGAAQQPTAVLLSITVPRSGGAWEKVRTLIPFMTGQTPEVTDSALVYKAAIGNLTTDPVYLSAGAVLPLAVQWDGGVASNRNEDITAPRFLVDVTKYV